ncbi:nucleotide-diphospho-sugar transferase [Cercophora newfieldiana]|uniref:Mannose-1-phosphate guanyltransferase n=1 Tax=Cercophora newfieldiana TaxID=92897 RepID=A0AA39YF46_9PEZI|nr:nucleotide-diphospho-sugar transferase [Cercophora newfieldiana]
MPHAVTTATPGLQALILCGPGSSFPTFTANPDENPKALLPIANRPMVWYPLEFCYRAGITNITLICPPSAAEAITTALNTNPFLTSLPYPKADLLSPKDLDQNTGTAQILRLPEVQALVTSDFLVLPCDLVCELGADKLLQAWMVKSVSLASLLSHSGSPRAPASGGLGVWYPTKTATPVKGEETDFTAVVPLPPSSVLAPRGSLFPHMSKVVYSMPTDSRKDLVEEESGFPVRNSLLKTHPRVRMLTTHRDAHFYIFPRWVMDFIRENEALETIGEDVVGWWVKAGWQKGLSTKLGLDEILGHDKDDESKEEDKSGAGSTPSPSKSAAAAGQTQSVTVKDKAEQARKSESTLAGPSSSGPLVPPMLAYIHPSQPAPSTGSTTTTAAPATIIRRVDTSQLLLQVSLQLAKLPSIEEVGPEAASPFAHPRKVAYPEGVKPRTTITKVDSLVADNVTVQEKSSIKECVIGANCQINEGAKLIQCLLMDGVVVGKNCKLTKCILGKRSEIGEGCVLTDCEVQENMLVERKTEAKEEKFMSSSGLEATEQDLEGYAEDIGEDDAGED